MISIREPGAGGAAMAKNVSALELMLRSRRCPKGRLIWLCLLQDGDAAMISIRQTAAGGVAMVKTFRLSS
jgi:hypothetical protein